MPRGQTGEPRALSRARAAEAGSAGREPPGQSVLFVGSFEKAEKRCVLGEQDLHLRQADSGPVLDPGLGEVVFDGVEATLAHLVKMIDFWPGGYMGRTAYLSGRPGLTRCSDT
jgi:hypothetical protein